MDAELANSKTGDDFFWASTNTGSADRNFVMYSYPYTDKDTFTKEYFVHKRDSVMKANISLGDTYPYLVIFHVFIY